MSESYSLLQGFFLDGDRGPLWYVESNCVCTGKVNAVWFLLIVLLAPPSGIDRVTVLNTFETYEDCQPERNRIGFEMAESYPYENDFRIVCEFRSVNSSFVPIRHARQARGPFSLYSNPLTQ
jgi:hypothetical protein